ncbi:MAG: porin family protein [Acidimicrobiia bacterium]|nr:porin family protein [Acidimicrobiia bacterium]
MRRFFPIALVALAGLFVTPTAAEADITAFFGVGQGPETRTAKGLSFGVSLIVVGFEVEYSDISAKTDVGALAPRLRTGMINAIVQTPTGGMQLYATAGVGGYRENSGGNSETSTGINVGGGLKTNLLGPLRLRLDYRLFTLRGNPAAKTVHRVYAGVNAAF